MMSNVRSELSTLNRGLPLAAVLHYFRLSFCYLPPPNKWVTSLFYVYFLLCLLTCILIPISFSMNLIIFISILSVKIASGIILSNIIKKLGCAQRNRYCSKIELEYPSLIWRIRSIRGSFYTFIYFIDLINKFEYLSKRKTKVEL